MVIGVLADTHGLLRPEAVQALEGCERIIHAGDLGKPNILPALNRLAPTVAVRGNVDRGAWADELPATLLLSDDGVWVYVLHDLGTMSINPVAAGVSVVISGHSHQPAIKEKDGVLYLNPGSAGPRRFSLPITLARLEVGPSGARATLYDVLTNAPFSP